MGGDLASQCVVREAGTRPRTPSSPLDPWGSSEIHGVGRVVQHHSNSPTVAPARKPQPVFPHGWNGGGESDSGAHCPPRGMVGIGGIVGTTGTYICDRSHGRIPVHLGRGLQIVKTMANVSAHPGHHGIHGGRGAFCQLERERDRDTGEGWRSAARWRVGGGASVGRVGGVSLSHSSKCSPVPGTHEHP